MRLRLLIDENLSPSLAALARSKGIEAEAAAYSGKAGWPDHKLTAFALEHGYVIVTNNRRDFLKLYLNADIHSGLIVIVPLEIKQRQLELFEIVLKFLTEMNQDSVNQLIEVLKDGSIHIRQWTSDDHDLGHITNLK